MADGERLDDVFGLAVPPWIEDWNHVSHEHMGGPLGYTSVGVTYFARFEYVRASLQTAGHREWQVLRRSDIRLGGGNDQSGRLYVLVPDIVRTVFTTPAAGGTDARLGLTRHLRDVLVNEYGIAPAVVRRRLLGLAAQLHPHPVYINGEEHDGWRVDDLPLVTALTAVADRDRSVSVVIDRNLADSMTLRLVDRPIARG